MYDYGYSYGYGLVGGNTYNPLINYDWSTTTAKEYKTDGVELLTNGGFDTDLSGWINTNNHWQWVNGRAYFPLSSVNNYLVQFFDVPISIIEFDLEIVSGTMKIEHSSSYSSFSTSGHKVVYTNGSWDKIVFSRLSECEFYIDNISVQKVIQEPNKRYLKDVGSTPTYNASMYFGRGAYLNGVDQTITVPINTTIQTALKRVNGIVTINETSQTLTNYVISGLGVHKDYYLFTRLLTTAEKDSYTNTPELFYAMAQADSTCVLNMPMCETSSTSRNYKTGIDYQITNYTTSVRDNAKNLQYGLQTCKFVRDSLGVIQSASDYLVCDGVGYGNTCWIPKWNEDFTVETVLEMSNDLAFRLNGNNYANGVFFGEQTTGNNLYVRVFGSPTAYIINTKNIVCLTFSYNWQSKEVKCYADGVFATTVLATQTTNSTLPVLLGLVALTGDNYPLIKPIRLFKVHSKVLTREDITKNFNKYQSQGLLNE